MQKYQEVLKNTCDILEDCLEYLKKLDDSEIETEMKVEIKDIIFWWREKKRNEFFTLLYQDDKVKKLREIFVPADERDNEGYDMFRLIGSPDSFLPQRMYDIFDSYFDKYYNSTMDIIEIMNSSY